MVTAKRACASVIRRLQIHLPEFLTAGMRQTGNWTRVEIMINIVKDRAPQPDLWATNETAVVAIIQLERLITANHISV